MAPLPDPSRMWWCLLLVSCIMSAVFAQLTPPPEGNNTAPPPGGEEEPFPNNCTRAVPLYLPQFQVEELVFPGLPCITTLHAQPWKRLLLEFTNVNIDASVFECELAGASLYSLNKGLLTRLDRICGTLNSSRAYLTEENVGIVTFGTTIPSSESTFSVRAQVMSGQGYTSSPYYGAPTPTQVVVSSYPFSTYPQYTSAHYSPPQTQQPHQQYYQQQSGHGGYYSGSSGYSPPSTSAPYQPPQRPSYSQYPYPNSYQPPPFSVTFTSTTTPSPLPSETPPPANQQPPPSFSRNFPPSGPLFLANDNNDDEGDNFISKTNYRPVVVYQKQISPPVSQGSDFFTGNCNETDWHVSKTDPVYYYWGKPQTVGVYPEESDDPLQYTDDFNEIPS